MTLPSDEVRLLSQELFSEIKPFCVELTNLALLPTGAFDGDSRSLLDALAKVENTLKKHYLRHKGVQYRLSANIADYIFFPLSNLLQKPSLNDSIIQYILGILAFLLEHVWSFDPNPALMGQLYPLVTFLLGGANTSSQQKSKLLTANLTVEFKYSGILCINTIIKSLPPDFYGQSTKNLGLLGNTITVVLEVIESCTNPTSTEEIELVTLSLDTLTLLYATHITPENASHVFPGTISKLINFYTMSRSLNFKIICDILRLIRIMIVKVFSDESLQIEVRESKEMTLEDLGEMWDEDDNQSDQNLQTTLVAIPFDMPTNTVHRTKSWLKATSKQLKISLVILFKDLLSNANNVLKVQNKLEIQQEIIQFFKQTINNCFISLFNELIPLAFDIFSMLISVRTQRSGSRWVEDESAMVSSLSEVFTGSSIDYNKGKVLYNQVQLKLSDLINNRLSSVMVSIDSDRIRLYIISMKFQFKVLLLLSQKLSMGQEENELLITNLVGLLQNELVRSFVYGAQKKVNKKDILSILSGQKTVTTTNNETEQELVKENKFDEVELPPYIDATKIATINTQQQLTSSSPSTYSNNIAMLATTDIDKLTRVDNEIDNYFQGIFTASIESQIVELITYLGNLNNSNLSLTLIENILTQELFAISDDSELILNKSIGLWMANNLFSKVKQKNKVVDSKFNIDDFLVFDEDQSEVTKEYTSGVIDHSESPMEVLEDVTYMIMNSSQELIDMASEKLRDPESLKVVSKQSTTNNFKVYEMAYAVAIDSLGTLSGQMTQVDFQQDFLIEYLYPLLEALTFLSTPLVQSRARISLEKIVSNHYHGSLENLIMENLDYLVDSLSLKLSVASSLSPALPGILLVILKICGVQLLLENQLLDILSEMFTLIDSYHGYASLVEGFFIVFEELIQQVKIHFARDSVKRIMNDSENISKYKPWGMQNVNQLLKLISDSEKVIDPYGDYDSSKEYFKRKSDKPFSEQFSDSDDEDSDNEDDNDEQPKETKEEDIWTSNIPKPIYLVLEKIFNYGFRLLSHSSLSLRIRILNMLSQVYPLLCTDYKLVLPLISRHWPVLMSLAGGASNLSVATTELSHENSKFILPCLTLLTVIIEQDREQDEAFLGRKFLEMWDFLTTRSHLFPGNNKTRGKPTSSVVILNPKIISAYAKLVITGLDIYKRIIPDSVAFEMTTFCWKSGLLKSNSDLSNIGIETRNILWVLKENYKYQ